MLKKLLGKLKKFREKEKLKMDADEPVEGKNLTAFQLELLRILEKHFGKEEAERIFLSLNDNIMLTAKDVTKELRAEMKAANEKLQSEISQTKWILAAIGLAIAVINFLAKRGHL